ncbi:MAG: 3'-5' exonuclease [Curvibacter sp.]
MRPPDRTPDHDAIQALEPFERLGLDRIRLIATPREAQVACGELAGARHLGFDTESRPTFRVGEVSDGPHIVQLATPEQAYIFQLHDLGSRGPVAELLALPQVVKAGFGLRDDRKRITSKLGREPEGVLELNTVLRERGYRKEMGVKAAVAVLFQRRFIKSKKAATSNWAAPRLSEAQLVYAANDAWAAIRVFHALGLAQEAGIR